MSEASPQTGPTLARALYSKGAIWIEATPIGGPAEVRAGTLTLLTAGPAQALERIAPVLGAFAAKTLRLGELGTGPLAKALASAFGAVATAVYSEMLILAKAARLDPAGMLAALPLLAPQMGTPPAAVAEQVLTGGYDSGLPMRRMQEDVARVLDAARDTSTPAPFLSLLQAACASAAHSPRASGDHLDLARWMADNAGIEFESATVAS
jgi:2-hydroxy-3-oxopropionate reductase